MLMMVCFFMLTLTWILLKQPYWIPGEQNNDDTQIQQRTTDDCFSVVVKTS